MPDFGDSGYDRPGGRYEYEGQVNPNDPSVANGQITPEQWAEYQKQRRKAAILGLTGTLGGMLFAQPFVNAIGLGGPAAGSASASATGGASLPAAATEGMLPMSVAAPSGAGAGFMGLSPTQWTQIALGGAGTIGQAMNRPSSSAPSSATTDPNMQRLINTMQGRLDQSEPLYKSIMAMANGLLPTQYQKGGGGMP